MEDNILLTLSKDFMVAKDNKLIHSKFEMSALEQKLVLILASTIRPEDYYINRVSFRIKDLSELMDVTPEFLYKELPKATKKIMSKVIEVQNSKNKWEMMHIVSYANYDGASGLFTLEFCEQVKPYLIHLQQLYTAYKLENVLSLSSKYAIRLYELTKSHSFKGQHIIKLEEFKSLLQLKQLSYMEFGNINAKVLKPSIKEINSKTDLHIEVTPIKLGKKVEFLQFDIKSRIKITQGEKASSTIKNKLKCANFTEREYDVNKLEKQLLGY